MLNKIDNLDELLAEKAKVQAQIRIVEKELVASSRRTREELETFVENKFALSKQIGQLFKGGTEQAIGGSAIGALGRAVGMGSWWTGLLSFLGPVVLNFVQEQIQRHKARKNDAAAKPKAPKTKKRNIFKRKPKPTPPEQPDQDKA